MRAQCLLAGLHCKKATSCRLHFKHSLNKCCHNRQAITDNNVSNLWIKNSLRIYWHWQTVAAFSLQLFTLSCASKTGRSYCVPSEAAKQWQGLKLPLSSLPPPGLPSSSQPDNLTSESFLIGTSIYAKA